MFGGRVGEKLTKKKEARVKILRPNRLLSLPPFLFFPQSFACSTQTREKMPRETKRASIWTCYLLHDESGSNNRASYIGSTNNLAHRLRQHRGELVGGARATSRRTDVSWGVLFSITGIKKDTAALSLEWNCKGGAKRNRMRSRAGIQIPRAPRGPWSHRCNRILTMLASAHMQKQKWKEESLIFEWHGHENLRELCLRLAPHLVKPPVPKRARGINTSL